ncbi:MAG: UbiD family decarboxylase [Deltaproteobacteria bacterium]|nr:UbiD family decarboxylase [Deltaproteobacteria bacterium]
MTHTSTRECVLDLARAGHLLRIETEVDPDLEMAEIHRRVFRAGGPALYFVRVRGCRFPMASNLYGTMERARFIFRDTLEGVRRLVELRADLAALWRNPARYASVPWTLLRTRPRRVAGGPLFANQIAVGELPQLRCWPEDGGAFVTLPQVYSEDPRRPGPRSSNLGMYRVQLSGGGYEKDREVGLHYQLQRGIGVHHEAALARGEPLFVNIYVGGPPAMTVAAMMPLPEGMPELALAGALGGRRVRLARQKGWPLPICPDADFCILGEIHPGELRPEGPFGDHLGYYSLRHDFPCVRVRRIYHRGDAVWPFTVVGRPPQEDGVFGQLVHELTGPLLPTVLPGVRAVNAVDAAGVHPLLLAVGSERYQAFAERAEPQELLTQANALLGQGQLSLAKYLFIVAENDDANLRPSDVPAFFRHLLERVDWRRDLHFQTRTTIDTLDYSGPELNQGSKLVVAAVGAKKRELPTLLPADLRLPVGFSDPRVVLPGILAVRATKDAPAFCAGFWATDSLCAFPLVVLVDDSEFAARSLDNFLWVTFTRSNPAVDVDGIAAATRDKHWGCAGSLVIDARTKPHHAPPLVEDPAITARVDTLFARGGPLAGLE